MYPVVSGSPAGINPPVENTIANAYEKAFQKQRNAKEKAAAAAALHHDTRQRIVQYLASPTSHHDPLRLMPVEQLESLSDSELVRQALAFLTIDYKDGTVRLSDGITVSFKESASSYVKKLTN